MTNEITDMLKAMKVGWQDIESAPGDGVEVLVKGNGWAITQMHAWWVDEGCTKENKPAQWRPLGDKEQALHDMLCEAVEALGRARSAAETSEVIEVPLKSSWLKEELDKTLTSIKEKLGGV